MDELRSRIMRAVRSKDTGPELLVRRLIHSMGFRYRLHRVDLPGRPDIVFPSKRKIILVHGCFWHGHSCSRGRRTPKSNVEYWREKISKNLKRDNRNLQLLAENGWRVLIVWECELKNVDELAIRLSTFLQSNEAEGD